MGEQWKMAYTYEMRKPFYALWKLLFCHFCGKNLKKKISKKYFSPKQKEHNQPLKEKWKQTAILKMTTIVNMKSIVNAFWKVFFFFYLKMCFDVTQ